MDSNSIAIYDLDRLESIKLEGNKLFSESEYKKASELYYKILKECFKLKTNEINVEELENVVGEQKNKIQDPDIRIFLSKICCNLGICHNSLGQKQDSLRFFKISLVLDDQNYKSNYHVAHYHITHTDYNTALTYIQNCQKIVNSNLNVYKKIRQPHLDLLDQIKQSLIKTNQTVDNVNDPKHLVEDICSGNNININIQRLQLIPCRKLLLSESVKSLVQFCKNKLESDQVDEHLCSVWSCLYHILYKCEEESVFELREQFLSEFEEDSLTSYVMKLIKLKSQKVHENTLYTSVLSNIVKCCPLIKRVDSLEVLLVLLDKEIVDLELLLTSILLYFSKESKSKSEVKHQSSKFNSILLKLLENLFSLCDDETFDYQQQLKSCLISVFTMKFDPYEVSTEAFVNTINIALEPYVHTEFSDNAKKFVTFSTCWYVVLNSLFLANKTLFKSYLVTTRLLYHVITVYFNENCKKIRKLAFELLLNCVDTVEFRQEILDYVEDGQSFIELLNSPEFVNFIETVDNETNLDLNNKLVETKEPKKKLEGLDWFVQTRILMFCKLSLHSSQVKDEVLSVFNIFKQVPRCILYNIKHKLDLEILLQGASFASLHEEFKKTDLSFLPSAFEYCNNSEYLLHYFLQTICNLLRGNKDRTSFTEDLDLLKYDREQLDQLKTLQEKLPEEAKVTVNGNYFEGNDESANMARSIIFTISNSAIPNQLCTIFNKVTSETSKSLIVESLHYLALNVNHRRYLQTLGAMRILINVANSSKYQLKQGSKAANFRKMNRYKLIVQSIAHLIISMDPANLSFNDAHDSIQPLINVLEDENELFQFESCLALTNLLSINDDIRKRVFALNGWDKFSNLVFSENEMLRTAGLEGWCNLCAGDDVVHGHFYMKIKTQIENTPPDKVYDINVHDINIMLLFVSPGISLKTLSAASGYVYLHLIYQISHLYYRALALLVRDGRIAQYMPFVSRFENVLKTLDSTEDPSILHRLLTILSCVVQSRPRDLSEPNEKHMDAYIEKIVSSVRRNSHKYSNKTLLDLFREIC
ncbi:uncharacterized protein TA08675 [Theileria annulata]|uniref:Protein unc-45 homolog B n=1 Tax=Theileria annulata TaxID=5874 RepID=Q4U9I3_THEAN|nr:uncharacterized protein TA08675 [Theileria annulata]CAI76520.1 hypothetical protein, conserved [Theileria annulata]|eukprot:XP_953145.1 hypothetical protein, conserved [Theileria annulata]